MAALLWRGARVTSSFAYYTRSVNIIPRAFIEVYRPMKDKDGNDRRTLEYKLELIRDQVVHFPEEFKKWGDERRDYMKKHKQFDWVFIKEHNDYEVLFKFNSDEDINQWILTTDTKNKEGTSSASLRLGRHRTGIFSGFLSTKPCHGGLLNQTGYVNIMTKTKLMSFFRQENMDWRRYTHVLIRCRGDGRKYLMNVHMDRYFDVQWNDTYSYPLYTRGGPYWQLTKIPITKLVFNSGGRVQDDQKETIDNHQVARIGISLSDTCNGPFALEIDFIALTYDANHRGDTEYEMYDVPLSYHY